MTRAKWLLGVVMLVGVAADGTARRESFEIPGTITETLTIYEDAQLTEDVQCEVEGAACVVFGVPNITLQLNGFTIRGRIQQQPTGCVTTSEFFPEDGISIIGVSEVAVLGPGRVENFGRFGLFLRSSSQVTIKRVTVTDNCFSGIQVTTVTDSEVLMNVSARNAMGSEGFPCGGI